MFTPIIVYAEDHFTEAKDDVELLTQLGYHVLFCDNAQEAFEKTTQFIGEVTCVIIDIVMKSGGRYGSDVSSLGQRTGELLYTDVRGVSPVVPIVMISRDENKLETFKDRMASVIGTDTKLELLSRSSDSSEDLVRIIRRLTSSSAVSVFDRQSTHKLPKPDTGKPSQDSAKLSKKLAHKGHKIVEWLISHSLWKLMELIAESSLLGKIGSALGGLAAGLFSRFTLKLRIEYSIPLSLVVLVLVLFLWDYVLNKSKNGKVH